MGKQQKGGKIFAFPRMRHVKNRILCTEDDRDAFAAARKEAGLEDLTFHDLRHTFASRLREARGCNHETGSFGTQQGGNERRLHTLIRGIQTACSGVDC